MRHSQSESRKTVPIANLPDDAAKLVLWRKLAAYGDLRKQRIASLPAYKAALAKLALVGLQQRLLSSIAAFLRIDAFVSHVPMRYDDVMRES